MVKKANNKKHKSAAERSGFTIIEVVLVLAVAALIFLMVFIALPYLRRSQRDNERRTSLGKIDAAVTAWQSNHNGRLPENGVLEPTNGNYRNLDTECPTASSGNVACLFVKNYMNGANQTENEFVDPDGWTYGLTITTLTRGDVHEANSFDHMVYLITHAACDNEVARYALNPRDYAVQYKLEGSGTYCKDNGGSIQ